MSSLKECLLGNPALWECLAEWQDDGTAVVLKELVLGAGLAVGLYHATVCLESLGQSGLVYQVLSCARGSARRCHCTRGGEIGQEVIDVGTGRVWYVACITL